MGVFKGISTILKGGFLGYCIYYTIERRVWDDPIFSPPQLNHIQKVMFPDLPEKIDKLPDKVTIYKACRDSWNRGVENTMETCAESPRLAVKYAKEFKNYFQDPVSIDHK
ncbi:uncharacterized protein LOC135924971 [Gordionus sp. m RMFG-2023]|uniref:uncharacterized protein LOC135924971 n=1 Tax=Gordionus sp. m RMFG-2023 TaxID=3053472 RepID=UPI0031FC0FD3